MDPIAMAMMAAANNPQMWGPMFDQMNIPTPDNPAFAQIFSQAQQQPDLGGMLNPTTPLPGMLVQGGPPGPPIGPQEGQQPPGPPQAAPLGPDGQPQAPPNNAVAAVDPRNRAQQVPPQVRAPTPTAPIMSGGVAGAQKAPDMKLQNAGPSPAQSLMAAMLGGGQNQNPLRVPQLGALLRGGRY